MVCLYELENYFFQLPWTSANPVPSEFRFMPQIGCGRHPEVGDAQYMHNFSLVIIFYGAG
jgi:hypothetical protein